MGGSVLALDQIWSATSTFTVKWSAGLESNKAHRVLHYLLCRLYDEGRGQLVHAHFTLAQATLARKLGLSRQWVGILVSRLADAGWIEYHSSKLPDGTNSSSVWRVGRMLKRLLVMLAKSRRGKKQRKDTAVCHWHFSPQRREKEILSIRERENQPPTLEVLARIPMLKQWLQRGKE
jgi:DNA-binding Lrp family transcriptional regulator